MTTSRKTRARTAPPTPTPATESTDAPLPRVLPDPVDAYIAGRSVDPARVRIARHRHDAQGTPKSLDETTRAFIDGGVL